MDNITRYENIEAYLDGNLPATERVLFEQQMAEDAAFAAEVALHRKLQSALGDQQKMAFRQQLTDIAAEFSGPTDPGPGAINPRYWWAAAVIILIAALSWWLWPSSSSNQDTTGQTPPAIDQPTLDTTTTSPAVDTITAQQPVKKQVPAPVNKPNPQAAFEPNPTLEKLTQTEPDPYFNVRETSLEGTATDVSQQFSIVFWEKC
ncbi:MAG: hypothetical protein IPL65_08795 [Lewinellaceae bacterium]|nr:hypothetical protein [Lewinellaceae bacterium]